ncbi:MAG: c-type cytochrome [Gammaproteobacteria bacterium]|nr:c-type cytochrome [Gammaproteobacteria bacterium]
MTRIILMFGVLALALGGCGKEESTTITPTQQGEAPATPAPPAPVTMTAPAPAPEPEPEPVLAPEAAVATSVPEPSAAPSEPAPASAGAALDMAAGTALGKQNGCFACHHMEQKRVGPAWSEVGKQYKGDAGARDSLIKWVHSGGSGRWQMGVMPAYSPRVSDADIEKLVDFILSLPRA